MPLTFQRKVDIVTGYLDSIGALDFDGAGEYLADNAVMTVPFTPAAEDVPSLVGKQAILDQMRGVIRAGVRADGLHVRRMVRPQRSGGAHRGISQRVSA